MGVADGGAMQAFTRSTRILCCSLLAAVGCSGAASPSSLQGSDAGSDGGSTGPSPEASSPESSGGNADASPDAAVVADGCVAAVTTSTVACTESNTSCANIIVSGDVPTSNATGFYGYADPTARSDPASSTAWMMYSWLVIQPTTGDEGGTVDPRLSENHLAQSSDEGGSWTKDEVVWPVISTTYQGEAGFLSSETAGFTSATSGGSTLWYAIHERYFTPALSGYNPTGQTLTVRVAQAATLADLAGQSPSDELVLSGPGLDPAFGPSVNLSAVDGAAASALVAACSIWHDTEIFYDQGKLYVGVECAVDDPTNAVLAVFVTTPTGAMTSWTWSLAGTLGDPSIAAEISSQLALDPPATSMTQLNLTRGKNGQLLAVMTPTSVTQGTTDGSFTSTQVHMGNVAVQLDSLDPIAFSRDCAGHLIIPSRTTADDEVLGTGSSTYDPALTTGIILDRQPTHTTGFEMHATGLRP